MSQIRRTIEQLLHQGILPLKNAEAAATHLEVYPSKRSWLTFFDKVLLVIGLVALMLALVFFIAYNWIHMDRMGKFALVEGALVITIVGYALLAFKRKFKLIQQLLLLIASVIMGSLLALFGQVYQTGADTWQLFFSWAIMIIPWVVIARFPALWLLWLGLMNAYLILYLDVANLQFVDHNLQSVIQVAILALVNLVALYLWLISFDHKHPFYASKFTDTTGAKKRLCDTALQSDVHNNLNNTQTKPTLPWSTYVVGIVSTFFMTYLAILPVFENSSIWATLISVILWLGWCGFMLWQFYQRRVDLLMLTYLSFSLIIVMMFWVGEWLLDDFETAGFLILALLLIGMSSVAVVWLRKVANPETPAIERGFDHE